jgi:hypothetical protein
MSNVDSTLTMLAAAGFPIIQALLSQNSKFTSVIFTLEGGLQGFLDLAKDEKLIVLSSIERLEETDFLYDPNLRVQSHIGDSKRLEAQDFEIYDLRKFVPEIRQFSDRLNQNVAATFYVPYQGVVLTWRIEEPWLVAFDEMAEEAIKLIEQRHIEKIERLELANQKELEIYLTDLKLLTEDPKFIALALKKSSTLKSLFLFAKTVKPKPVKALGDARAKDEIANFVDLIRLGL